MIKAGKRRRFLGLGISMAALCALLAPATASANHVSCNFAAPTLTVTIAAGVTPGEAPAVQRSGNDILVFNQPGPSTACSGGTPTVTTTDTINVNETAVGAGTTFRIFQTGGPFAPGVVNEAGDSDEIEWNVAFESTGTDPDNFGVTSGGAVVDNFRFGQGGGNLVGNLNGDEASGIDVDVTATNADVLLGNTDAAADTFTGDGGAAVPGSTATTARMDVIGGAGNDILTAGAGTSNQLFGGAEDDTLTGGPGADTLSPAAGNDIVNGGGGTGDFISYEGLAGGVALDLCCAVAQPTGGQGTETVSNVENFIGSNGNDVVLGTIGPNTLQGGSLVAGIETGNDTFYGREGNDILHGVGGNDSLHGQGNDDQISGGPGVDAIDYSTSAGGVTASLATFNVAQPTGGSGTDTLIDSPDVGGSAHLIENIVGSPSDDVLTGDANPNELIGAAGADSLTGGNGVDILRGGTEADNFLALDATADTIDCTGGGADTGTFDPVETYTGCDTDGDGVLNFTDACPADAGTLPNGCVAPVTTPVVTPVVTPTVAGPTGERAAALKKCKKKRTKKAKKKCKKRARRLPV